MVFGEIVGEIGFSGCPENLEVSLFDAIAYPVETHVDGPGALLVDGIVGDSAGGRVVGLNGRGVLWISHFVERGAKDFAFIRVDAEACDFGSGCSGHVTLPNSCDLSLPPL